MFAQPDFIRETFEPGGSQAPDEIGAERTRHRRGRTNRSTSP
jgi:hypothetical protein